MIIELAVYEKAREQVLASVEDIEHSLFGPGACSEALICTVNGEPAGYAVFFMSYSTGWVKTASIWKTCTWRRSIAARAPVKLLRHIAQLACEQQCGRTEWSVLDWNQPAIDFYLSIGAQPQGEWVRYRMEGEALTHFAAHGAALPA